MVELELINPAGEKQKFSLEKDVISIGRKSDNDVPIKDSEMSRYHASIRFENGKYFIFDLNSTNGIYFRNARVKEKQELFPKTEIKIGSHSLVFMGSDKLSEPDKASPAAKKETPAARAAQPEAKGKEEEDEIKIDDPGHTVFLAADVLAKKATDFGLQIGKEVRVDSIQVENVNKNLEILYNVGKRLLNIKDIQGISSMILETVDKIMEAERIAIQLKDENGELATFSFKGATGKDKFRLSKTITSKVLNEGIAMMTSNALADERFSSGASVIMQAIRAMMCVPIWKEKNFMGLIYLDNQHSMMGFRETDLQIISAVANQAAIGIDNIRLNESIQEEIKFRNNLERYHSPDVIDMIMKDPASLFNVTERDVTILFSDIKGFTSLSERLTAKEIAEILNEYFDHMSDAIFANKGTLDKFIGDAIMAVFGAPFTYGNDALNAVQAALDMLRLHKELMDSKPGDMRFGIRIGINTGKVVAGNIGSKKRVDYTVLGDAVNIASRLESMADVNSVFIGESTYERVKDAFTFREVGHSKLKGKEKSVLVYQALSRK